MERLTAERLRQAVLERSMRLGVDEPVPVQFRRHGATFCGRVRGCLLSPDGRELFKVDAELLGTCYVQASGCIACGDCSC